MGSYFIIVELDENGHESYEVLCEFVRMHEIIEEARKPVYMIRFNPDEWNERKSCFGTTFKNGELKWRVHELEYRWGLFEEQMELAMRWQPEELDFLGVAMFYPEIVEPVKRFDVDMNRGNTIWADK